MMAMKFLTSSIPILPRNVQLQSEDILWTTQLCWGHSLKQDCCHQYALRVKSPLELIIWSCQQQKTELPVEQLLRWKERRLCKRERLGIPLGGRGKAAEDQGYRIIKIIDP